MDVETVMSCCSASSALILAADHFLSRRSPAGQVDHVAGSAGWAGVWGAGAIQQIGLAQIAVAVDPF